MKALEKPIIRYNDPNGFDNELNTMNNMCQEEGYAGTYYLLPLTPLARILITTPLVVIAELVIGFVRFRKIQFK